MSKLILIGIDSLDPILLSKYQKYLPNFTKLMKNDRNVKLKSVFPPDTFSAWPSIFTGLNPAKHGILFSADIFLKKAPDLDTSILQGITFWDIAGKYGKKVCILYPSPLVFPPWKVNGVMVSKSWENRRKALPHGFHERFKKELNHLDEYGPIGGFQRLENLHRFAQHVKKITLEETGFGLKVLHESDFDLFFIFFEELDQIQHFFWRYCDENDPTHPVGNPYEGTVMYFYQLFDSIVGEFMHSYKDASFIIFSDHGHGLRPPNTVNINELLRMNGLLFSKAKSLNPVPYLLEIAKKGILDFVYKLNLDYQFVNLTRNVPITKGLYTSTYVIDWERTITHLSNFVGPKSYPHGGIEIKGIEDAKEYEKIRELIIKILYELVNPKTNEKLIEWACKREDLYTGEYINKYPDVVFLLKNGYGVYWAIHTPLIGTAYEHNLSSGGHKEDAVFLTHNINKPPVKNEATLMDVAPTILHLLGITKKFNLDGKPIFQGVL